MTNCEYLLGIDVGTYGVKSSLWTLDGRLVGAAKKEYGVSHPQPMWAEQDPEIWWQALRSTSREVIGIVGAGSANIRGIGISAFVPPLVPLDKNGNVLRPAILSFDQRSIQQAARLEREVGREILEIAGNRIAPGAFSATSMLWLKEKEPKIFEKVLKFVHANGYIAYRLTGKLSMDFSNASTTLLFDTAKKRWSEKLCDLIGVPIEKLPYAMGSWEVVGGLTSEAAEDLGLQREVPVVAGGNDSACSMLGAGVVEPGMVLESVGTSIIFAYVNDKPIFDARVMNRCHVVPDRWFNLAGMSTPGASYRWFREEFGDLEKALAAKLNIDPYVLMDNEAERSPPGARGLIFLPYLSGERSPIWNPCARGVIFGLTLSHVRGDIIRAILEGGAYAVRDNMEVFTERGLEIKEIRVTGGGAKSRLWRQIMADVLGVPLQVPLTVETAAFGAAILAGCGAGIYEDPRLTAKKLAKVKEAEKPRIKQHRLYTKHFELFKKIYENLIGCYELAKNLEKPSDS